MKDISYELTAEEQKEKEYQKAQNLALRYLSSRDRTEFEVRKNLGEKELGCDAINFAIEYCKELNYIDDISYGEKYIGYGQDKGKAMYRIKRELSEKGLDNETIEAAVDNAFEDREAQIEKEKETAYLAAVKALGVKSVDDPKVQGKIARRLVSLGYSAETVYTILSRLKK